MSLRIDGAWEDNRKLYGARKIWHVLRRDGQDVARCTVERLMRALGIRGIARVHSRHRERRPSSWRGNGYNNKSLPDAL